MKLREVVAAILAKQNALSSRRALLVAISGIDAAGKGFITTQLAQELTDRDRNVAVIHVDDWLNLPPLRFAAEDPATNFYEHAIRFDEMFAQLIDPLTRDRSVQLEADVTDETATRYRKHPYSFCAVDVVLLEGIFLLKRAHRPRFDLAIWVDCSFATALRRALERSQEGLPPAGTVRAFETFYFPAQRIHQARDRPTAAAHAVISNELPGVPV